MIFEFFSDTWFFKVLKIRKNLEKILKMKKPFGLLNFTSFSIFWAKFFFMFHLSIVYPLLLYIYILLYYYIIVYSLFMPINVLDWFRSTTSGNRSSLTWTRCAWIGPSWPRPQSSGGRSAPLPIAPPPSLPALAYPPGECTMVLRGLRGPLGFFAVGQFAVRKNVNFG